MKRNTKLALIVAAALFVVGAVLCGISLLRVNFDFSKLSTSDPGQKRNEAVALSGVRAIQMSLDLDAVNIVCSDDDQIHVSWTDWEDRGYELSQDDGILKLGQVRHAVKKRWFRLVGFDWNAGDNGVELAVPANFDGDIQVEDGLGALMVSGLSLKGALDCKSDNGTINIKDLEAGSVSVKSSLGSVSGSDWNVVGAASAATDNGAVDLCRCTAASFSAKSSLGGVSLEQVAADMVDAAADSGSIKVEGLRADDITLESGLGSIKGTIDGVQTEYSVFPTTQLGSCNLSGHKGTTQKTLTASTDSGEIDLSFLQ